MTKDPRDEYDKVIGILVAAGTDAMAIRAHDMIAREAFVLIREAMTEGVNPILTLDAITRACAASLLAAHELLVPSEYQRAALDHSLSKMKEALMKNYEESKG